MFEQNRATGNPPLQSLDLLFSPDAAKSAFLDVSNALAKFIDESLLPKAAFISGKSFEELKALANSTFDDDSNGQTDAQQKFDQLLEHYTAQAARLHSPNYMGHQVPPPLPLAAAMDGLVSALNQGLAVQEMSPFATAIEHALVSKLCSYLGWSPEASSGFATSGGTLANTTALLAARNKALPSFWQKGSPPGVRPAIITSQDAHYSISKAAGVIGIGIENVVAAGVDDHRRMTGASLQLALTQAKSDGRAVFCVIASAPSTPIGAIDQLDAIASVCEQHGVWLHVDAVHGAPLLLSSKTAAKLQGITRADSVSWDAHKMMHVASLCTFLLFKDKLDSFRAFENKASYLFSEDGDDIDKASKDLGKRTFECTKRAVAAPLWAVWSTYGSQVFSQMNDQLIGLTEDCYRILLVDPEFDVPYKPDSNILVFRLVPGQLPLRSAEQINALQDQVHRNLLDEGLYYITKTTLDGKRYLRLTFMNIHTTTTHFQELLKSLKQKCSKL